MAHPLRNIIGLCLALAALPPAAFAQDNEDEATVSFDFSVFSLDRNPIEGVYFNSPSGDQELEFKKKARSVKYRYEGPPEVVFYEIEFDEEGEKIRIPVARATVDQTLREPLFFFLPNKKEAETRRSFRLLPVEDSESAFPYGYLRVVNASGAELVGKIGDEQIKIKFAATEPMPMDDLRANRNDPWVKVYFAAEVGEQYELVYRNSILFRNDGRSILVLRPPLRSRSIKIHTYLLEDYRPNDSLRPDEFQGS